MPGLAEILMQALLKSPAGQQVPPPQMNAQGMAPPGTGGIMDILSRAGQGMGRDVMSAMPVANMTGAGGMIPQAAMGLGANFAQSMLPQPDMSAPPMPKIPQMQNPAQPSPQLSSIDNRSMTQDFVNKKGGVAQQKEGGFDWKQALLRAGVPMGAAIAGSVNPGLLPQAAGLASGYNTGFNRQEDFARESEGTKPFIVYDPDTGEQQTINVPKKAIVQQKRKENDLFGIDFTSPEMQELMGNTKVGDTTKQSQSETQKIKESDIIFTMKETGLSRQEVLDQVGAREEDILK